MAKLQSLAAYFDTDSTSMAGLPPVEAIQKFSDMVRAFPLDISTHKRSH